MPLAHMTIPIIQVTDTNGDCEIMGEEPPVASGVTHELQVATTSADAEMQSTSADAVLHTPGTALAITDNVTPSEDMDIDIDVALEPAPMPQVEIPETILEAAEPGDTPDTKVAPVIPRSAVAGPSRSRPPTILSSLPVRRPSTRPLLHAAPAETLTQAVVTEPILRRKPSYPSSLGSGPLARPTQRVVSNPMRMFNPPPAVDNDPSPTSPRSVSEPVRKPQSTRPRMSLSMSTRHQDTTRNLAGLNDALARLRIPSETRTRRPPSVLMEERPLSASAPARMSNPAARKLGEKNQNTNGGLGDIKDATGTFLKGVVAYVDVYTAEGDDAGSTFADMLRKCGARVLVKRPTEMCTHIIYKGGRSATASFVRKLPAEKRPHVVGIKWVTRCAATRSRLPETEFLVNLDTEDVFQVRRKSMEPKSLVPVKPLVYNVPSGISGGLRAALAPSAAQNQQRYARELILLWVHEATLTPASAKISSPLKKSSYVPYDDENSM